jgi:hypothetical protein
VIDSLILIAYSTVLISIVIWQRESTLNTQGLFEWKELLRCNVESDEEEMYTDDVAMTSKPTATNAQETSFDTD